ncbi:MAG: hypothetical protein F2860_02420 [Actinobacteria bacterium]|nr:hypothetical protein [Actinomycetota bacterium]MSY08220.1 hypothetical protein [Actinomycetota bacterium]MSZ37099.1 hypothetical protein [Actinomycetota bacterium]MTA69851.1 hypothetical protein [Actinomycetota bacterium]MTB11158.1 hypothetical protein [Actinomycetota bacterium]
MRCSLTSVILGAGLSALMACGSNDTTQEVVPASPSMTEVATFDDVTANIIGTQTNFSLTAALAESPVAFWFWAPD